MAKPPTDFRNYAAEKRLTVKEFYRLNHRYQTVDFVLRKKAEYLTLDRRTMDVWEALEYLNTLIDDSDPDTDLTQMDHALQTAESIRRANQPRWFIAAGLIHDLGKILCLWNEPQWAVVGDTFPVGCAFSDKIVYPEFFEDNPDSRNPGYSTELGIYEPHCGLENVHKRTGIARRSTTPSALNARASPPWAPAMSMARPGVAVQAMNATAGLLMPDAPRGPGSREMPANRGWRGPASTGRP